VYFGLPSLLTTPALFMAGVKLRIPGEAAQDSEMMAPTIPI
jgi:hypothetical protein